MKMTARLPLLLVAFGALTACAAPYRLTPNVPTAELTFVTAAGGADALICDLDSLELRRLGTSSASPSVGGQLLSGFTAGLSDRDKAIVPLVRNIQAGNRVRVIGTSGSAGGYVQTTCSAGVDFIPESGARYKADYSYDVKAGQCYIGLKKFDAGMQDWMPEAALSAGPASCKVN